MQATESWWELEPPVVVFSSSSLLAGGMLEGRGRRDALDGRVLGEVVELPLGAHVEVEVRRNGAVWRRVRLVLLGRMLGLVLRRVWLVLRGDMTARGHVRELQGLSLQLGDVAHVGEIDQRARGQVVHGVLVHGVLVLMLVKVLEGLVLMLLD
jgi:hypothetical protein